MKKLLLLISFLLVPSNSMAMMNMEIILMNDEAEVAVMGMKVPDSSIYDNIELHQS